MFKLNFEKTVIFVLILILAISTANIYSQYISMFIGRRDRNEVHTNVPTDASFPAALLKADQFYEQKNYVDAQEEYLKLASRPNLSLQQKATVYFKLGVSNYRLAQYDLARDSFLKAAEYNNNDAVAYNNAAVASFYLNEPGKAEELQKKAIAILPIVEYHYNLGRIYEDSGRYEDAAKYYNAVVKGEENISKEDRIDPVRIKNKVMKLMTNMSNAEEISNELMIALSLNDAREVFIIEDTSMDIKGKDFKWRVVKENGVNRLYCSYDREKSDPYNLIDSLEWTVKSGGKTVYTGRKDNFSLSLAEGNSYSVYLYINYSTNKQVSSYADVQKSSGMYSGNMTPKPSPKPSPSEEKPKYYEYAVYEQVFGKDFRMSENGYVDRFNVVWGKDDIITRLADKDFIDAQGALYIKNTSNRRAGIWTDLSSLINDKRLKGKTIGVKFYAKKVSDNAGLHVLIKTKTGKSYKPTLKRYELDNKWQQYVINLPIPTNGDGLTMSFKTDIWEELQIDGFIIYIVK